MNCKVEKTEKANEVKLEITIEAEKFENAMKKVYFQNAKYFNIPGFRKGKAPMNIVEKYYGAQIFYEDAFNDVATEGYEEALKENKIDVKIMIMGLGSVGQYLLDYLCSAGDERIEIIVAGRNKDKMQQDVNIVRVAAAIRGKLRTKIKIVENCDLDNIESIKKCLRENQPDIIVNTSRVYAGLKYGSISWKNFRAYGIWTPLAIKYIKNIMEAVEAETPSAIVINTSYSDAVIPWLKSAGKAYPDFGSGNLNHLIPRIRFAVAQKYGINDDWNIDVSLATGHFHDVVISKEGQNEGITQLISVSYKGEKIVFDQKEILSRCVIPMPVDAKRNMMNASSNYEIISAILDAVFENKKIRIHIPGFGGNIGGYPVWIDGSNGDVKAYIDEENFAYEDMVLHNQKSMYKDGIEKIENGNLIYTDELIEKVQKTFGTKLPKCVTFEQIDETAEYIIQNIIKKAGK